MVLSLLVDAFSGKSLARYLGYGTSSCITFLLITEGWRPWVLLRRRRIKRLAQDANVVLFEEHLLKAHRNHDKGLN